MLSIIQESRLRVLEAIDRQEGKGPIGKADPSAFIYGMFGARALDLCFGVEKEDTLGGTLKRWYDAGHIAVNDSGRYALTPQTRETMHNFQERRGEAA